ncbi:MAG: histidine kinase [Rubrivivax sp.]|nr:histidine kinase [Rubrivivax sp.]
MVDLDSPLPDQLTGRAHGWFTRYRRYPVFSPAWARGRAATLGLGISAAALLLLTGAVIAAPGDRPYGAMAQAMIGVTLPLFIGPWLGSVVRRHGWPARAEGWALLGLVVSIVLGMAAFHEWGAEPIKQRIAEHTGMVDEKGQRRRVALMIGVTIQSPDPAASAVTATARGAAAAASAAQTAEPASAPSADPVFARDAQAAAPEPGPNALGRLMVALCTFAFTGGFALPRWWREREGLAALAQERELARAEAARREAELRLSVLAAQVEPHFLFNTLAGVRSAIATDPGRASEMIDRLTDYLRAAIPRLRSDGGAEATLGSQLEIVRAYLGLMRARMPRLDFAIDLPAGLAARSFPPLMLISLAENAVKHGVEPKIGPARIDVSARRTDDGRLQVTVADDGAGFGSGIAGSAGTGLGLANIRERLAQMYGERASLELRARPEGGVAASLTLPAG